MGRGTEPDQYIASHPGAMTSRAASCHPLLQKHVQRPCYAHTNERYHVLMPNRSAYLSEELTCKGLANS